MDFAHYTYSRGMCSCCYDATDLPERYWKKGVLQKIKSGEQESYSFILFKNAVNGSGCVRRNDKIKDIQYILWNMPLERLEKVCKDLYVMLREEFFVIVPSDDSSTIVLIKKDGKYKDYIYNEEYSNCKIISDKSSELSKLLEKCK